MSADLFPDPTPEQRDRVGEAARRLGPAKRTLTNLYNRRPTWLANAHADLDGAVFDAYGRPPDLPDIAVLERLLAVIRERAAKNEPN